MPHELSWGIGLKRRQAAPFMLPTHLNPPSCEGGLKDGYAYLNSKFKRRTATDIDKPSNLPLIREAINLGAIYLIYIICKFISYAEAPPTEAEKRLPQANLGKLSERFGAIVSENYVIIYSYLEIICIFV